MIYIYIMVYKIIFKKYVYRFKWKYILVGICFLLLVNFSYVYFFLNS